MAASSRAGHYRRGPRVLVVVSGWPRISETFAQNELAALHRAGMLAGIVATKDGDTALVQPGLEALSALVHRLPDGTEEEQAAALVDHVRSLADGVDALHGYFAHRPAGVARIAAEQLGIPFGFSVHARDVRKISADQLRAQGAAAAVVVTCNADAYATLDAAGVNAHLVPHGVDLDVFPAHPAIEDGTVHLLAVGRLVEKKGFPTLIDAMAQVADLPVELTIVGDGPDRAALEARIEANGLRDIVRLPGRVTHDDLPTMYRSADIVVAPSVIDRDGDRDGLPNVVLEGMASGRALVASDVAAIGTAVEHDRNGLLVAPGHAGALAGAIRALVSDPARRDALGAAARCTAEERFDLRSCGDRFCDELAAAYASAVADAIRVGGSRP